MRKPNKLESLERKEICHYLLTSVWKYIVYIYEEEQLGNYICLFICWSTLEPIGNWSIFNFVWRLVVKNLPANAGDSGDVGLIPRSGRSPGEGNGNPFQNSCLGNPMDRGAWWATAYGFTRVGHNLATKPPQQSWGMTGLCVCMLSCFSHSTSLWPHELQPTRLLCPWDSPGKNTGVGCHALLQGIFPTQGLNLSLLHLLHRQAGSLPLVPPEKPNTGLVFVRYTHLSDKGSLSSMLFLIINLVTIKPIRYLCLIVRTGTLWEKADTGFKLYLLKSLCCSIIEN